MLKSLWRAVKDVLLFVVAMYLSACFGVYFYKHHPIFREGYDSGDLMEGQIQRSSKSTQKAGFEDITVKGFGY